MTSNNRSIIAVVLAAAALIPFEARATVARAASFDEKVDAAESIVLGHCTKTRSQFDPTGRWILTYSTFAVEQTLKGQPTQELTIVTPGGEVAGVHQDTIGVPAFQQGDEHVLFVRSSRVGPTVLFFDQGAYDVGTDDRGDKSVKPYPSEVVRLDTQRGVVVGQESAEPLRVFQDHVRDSLRLGSRNRMEMVEKTHRQQTSSLWELLGRNRLLVAIALLGAALATWKLTQK